MKATPELYRYVFQDTEQGQAILDDLASRYYDNGLVGKDSNDTYFNLGQREVISFLIRQCGLAETKE